MEAWHIDHGEFRLMITGLFSGFYLDEHIPGKEAVPGCLGDDPDGYPAGKSCPCITVLDEDVLVLKIGLRPVKEPHEFLLFNPPTHTALPDLLNA